MLCKADLASLPYRKSMKANLCEILIHSADAAASKQKPDGSMLPGRNGPWNQQVTPVRNTAHWLIVFLKAYEISHALNHQRAAEQAIDYIFSEPARPHGYTFHCRNERWQNRNNGLIGQAWVIESLLWASKVLDRDDCFELAKEVFQLHPFDADLGLWYGRDIDGKVLSLNNTFNQQLWFAVCGAILNTMIDDNDLKDKIEIFLKNLNSNFSIYPSGLIVHRTRLSLYKKLKSSRRIMYLSVGYHAFNLCAFALLKKLYPDHEFWNNDKFIKALNYASSDAYKITIDKNPYAYSYNVTGIEMAFVLETFLKNSEDLQKCWLSEQLLRHYDMSMGLMDLNSSDPETLSARIYEITRLKNLDIRLEL